MIGEVIKNQSYRSISGGGGKGRLPRTREGRKDKESYLPERDPLYGTKKHPIKGSAEGKDLSSPKGRETNDLEGGKGKGDCRFIYRPPKTALI